MPADKQARQHAVHDVVVPDDHAAQLLVNGFVTLRKLRGPLFNRFGDRHGKGFGGRGSGFSERNFLEH